MMSYLKTSACVPSEVSQVRGGGSWVERRGQRDREDRVLTIILIDTRQNKYAYIVHLVHVCVYVCINRRPMNRNHKARSTFRRSMGT